MKKIYTLFVLAFVLFISVNSANATAYNFNVTSTRTLTVARAGNDCNNTSNSCAFTISGGTSAANVYLQLNESCTNCTFISTNSFSLAVLTANITLSSSGGAGFNQNTNIVGSYLLIPNGYALTLGGNINFYSGKITVGNANANTATAEINLNNYAILMYGSTASIYMGTSHSLIDDKSTAKNGLIYYVSIPGHVLFTANDGFYKNPSTTTPYVITGTSGGVSTYSLSGLAQSVIKTTNPSEFDFTTSGVTPLPIVLVDFNASLNSDNTVGLTWTTEQEENSNYFSVERSADGESWESLGTVAAQGNSSVATNYSFTDRTALGVINYYRLQAFDLDGKYSYSEVRIVRTTVTTGLSIFPNPAKSYLNIFFGKTTTEDLTIKLINTNGQVIQSKLLSAGGSNITIPVSTYPTGVYMLHISGASGSVQTTKVFITRE